MATRARVLTALLLILAAVTAPGALADDGPGEATITISFSGDGTTATIVSSKGISHYVYVLCDGTSQKVEHLGEVRSLTIGGQPCTPTSRPGEVCRLARRVRGPRRRLAPCGQRSVSSPPC